jgi:hypothetical protein
VAVGSSHERVPEMKWKYLLTVSKDMPGLGESWDINVARTSDGEFAWQTSGSDSEEAENAAIDTGSADWIADYLVENASGFESELLESLTNLSADDMSFSPLLDATKKHLGVI